MIPQYYLLYKKINDSLKDMVYNSPTQLNNNLITKSTLSNRQHQEMAVTSLGTKLKVLGRHFSQAHLDSEKGIAKFR